jgi:hypothetical protein
VTWGRAGCSAPKRDGALNRQKYWPVSVFSTLIYNSYAIHPKINLKVRMKQYGWTVEDFAKPAVKNSANGALADH